MIRYFLGKRIISLNPRRFWGDIGRRPNMAPPYRVAPVPGNPKLLDRVRDVIRANCLLI